MQTVETALDEVRERGILLSYTTADRRTAKDQRDPLYTLTRQEVL